MESVTSNSIRAILGRAATRVNVSNWFLILLPFLEQIFAAILEQCTNTEEEAEALITKPTDWQAERMQRQVRRAMRRQGDIPRKQRKACAWQVVTAVIEEANTDPEAVCAAFREVSA